MENLWAFLPSPLPPDLQLEPLINQLAESTRLLGELGGLGQTLANPYLLMGPLLRREAVASSNIEGTFTSLSDLFLLEVGADEKFRPPDTREVLNYVRAMEHGLARLPELPVCLRMFRELHEILLAGVQRHRGASITPGEFRRDQNRIGGRNLAEARYVPPPPNEVVPALDALEKFIQDPEPRLPILIRLALIHYQFEAIHPFPDGNGRVGRLIVPLLLCEKKALPQPLLYLSPYLESRREEYNDLMLAVSQRGAWNDWLEFFLKCIEVQANDAIRRARDLLDLQNAYREKVQQARASALQLKIIDILFESPFVTIPHIARELDVTYRGAQQNVQKLMAAGILKAQSEYLNPRIFFAPEIFEIIHRD